MTTSTVHKGGEWLTTDVTADDVFTPERLSDEHRLVGQTAQEFVTKEVLPALPELEKKNWTVARSLIKRAGDLGLLGTDVPEALGGVALDKAASIVVGEIIGTTASFATTFGAQTGLAIIPILCFGTEAQQRTYLPRILSGEIIGAYCMSESASGSDALGARARATRQPDGSWRLNGEKLWITNGGFADVFIVFAKVDGEQFSAFIVERGFKGIASGKEEHKMGLQGSSTTPILLSDAEVPAANLLGDVGKGHKIAFNVLNYGRFKLAAMCSGGAKAVVAEAVAYANSRRQFGQPIAAFGAIRHKLAEMTVRTFAIESALYRMAGLIDAATGSASHSAAALEEFAVEASALKVAATEMLDYAVDENVQIHGGNGFVADYPAEKHFRDARVNRIFEGTNEINRLLVPGMLIKRSLKGGVPVIEAARRLRDELLGPAAAAADGDNALANARQTVGALKKAALMAIGLALEKYGESIHQEQEILMLLADIIIDVFIAESAVLRAEQAASGRHAMAALQADAAAVYAHDAGLRADAAARTLLASVASGDGLRTALAALRRVLKVAPLDTIAARRRIAEAVIVRRAYLFG
ncbi:MAG TPA: acyl-CoA dehydrogenase family protein [Vicinamibacterales bacterium]|nr:acyl-CoA dehydrogenase family protein [Vicinamibacterales bacterium]